MTITSRIKAIYCTNITQLEQFEALYILRNLLNEVPSLDIFCAIELLLSDTEGSLLETDKDFMRREGYQFREDLDDVSELLKGGD